MTVLWMTCEYWLTAKNHCVHRCAEEVDIAHSDVRESYAQSYERFSHIVF